ncbi:3'-5' ssDNA/RNA exonuclease TatD [Frankliniella fusca]|uniref:Deoxyribonuclease TATDN1 n=1 Tax=Frankliniella fusca TaxID=407009 RepID=A0AAE1LPF5_9NEOP|nr:3'-5' ssDNA/RNA exonuclease TatD [Frankliniella fusca]
MAAGTTDITQNDVLSAENLQKCFDNYLLVDVGAGLTNKKFAKDLDSVIQRAKDAGLTKILVTGSSLRTSKEALRLTRIYPGTIYSSTGVHPHDAKSWEPNYLEDLREIAMNPECVAIGECGLDYSKDFSSPEVQRDVFEKQVQIACDLKKPLILREREAHADFLSVIDKYRANLPVCVLRGFSGTQKEAECYLDRGCYFTLSGSLCKDKSDDGMRRLLEQDILTMDRILVETDSPFMFPNIRASKLPPAVKESLTERSLLFLNRYCTFQRNEPCSLPAIVEMISVLIKKKPEEVAFATAFSALKVFGLSQ